MRLGKKHHLTATDAYELEGFIMDRFTKWLGNIRRTDEVPDAVKQTICDTLQNLPDAPERKIEERTWKRLAVAACVVILICCGKSVTCGKSSDSWNHFSKGREGSYLLR